MNFGQAIEALKEGKRVARAGWNGKGMWLVLVPATPNCQFREGTPYHAALNPQKEAVQQGTVTINAHIDMYTASGEMQPGWLASQTDMLSDDWGIVGVATEAGPAPEQAAA